MSCCHYSQIPNTAAFEIEKKCFIHLKGNRNKNSTKTRNNSALSKRHFSWTVFRGISYSNTMHFFVSGWTESWRTQSSEEQPENNMEFELQKKIPNQSGSFLSRSVVAWWNFIFAHVSLDGPRNMIYTYIILNLRWHGIQTQVYGKPWRWILKENSNLEIWLFRFLPHSRQ
jgi:hypothetical protein